MTETVEPIGVPEILCDSAGDIKIIAGVARIPLVVHRDGDSEVVGRLAIPIPELPDFIQSMTIALTEVAKTIVRAAPH